MSLKHLRGHFVVVFGMAALQVTEATLMKLPQKQIVDQWPKPWSSELSPLQSSPIHLQFKETIIFNHLQSSAFISKLLHLQSSEFGRREPRRLGAARHPHHSLSLALSSMASARLLGLSLEQCPGGIARGIWWHGP